MPKSDILADLMDIYRNRASFEQRVLTLIEDCLHEQGAAESGLTPLHLVQPGRTDCLIVLPPKSEGSPAPFARVQTKALPYADIEVVGIRVISDGPIPVGVMGVDLRYAGGAPLVLNGHEASQLESWRMNPPALRETPTLRAPTTIEMTVENTGNTEAKFGIYLLVRPISDDVFPKLPK